MGITLLFITRKSCMRIMRDSLLKQNYLFNWEQRHPEIKNVLEYINKECDIIFDAHFGFGFCEPGLLYNGEDFIFLLLKSIKERLDKYNEYVGKNLTFEEKICESITHEENHIWLMNEIGKETSVKYDNICYPLRQQGYSL